ncbi:exodeoxyribonuclease V subunit gamma [Buchnera aphidicola]|uniref:exodeoxyribonuclease V subunit gamma n=1 Tax=Buchnera aphidicola TaxID=9 RepID=UPI0030ECE68C
MFKKELFIIENLEISDFFDAKIAKIFGISINIKFWTLKYFIEQIIKKIFFYNKKVYKIKLSEIKWKFLKKIKFFYKKEFLRKKDSLIKKFNFFEKISKIFFKYFIYRPKLIKLWNKNKNYKKFKKNEKWQYQIWKKIFKNYKKNKVIYYLNFFYKDKKYNKKKFFNIFSKYSNIYILYSINAPKYYWKIIKIFSKYHTINLFINFPVNLYTLKKKKNKWFKNSQLSYWNKNQIYNVLYMLSNFKKSCLYIQNHKSIKNKKKSNLLKKIKKNIFFLKTKKKSNLLKKIKKKDFSFSIHKCENYHEEIQLLHKNILKILFKNKKIFPHHIIVKCNNLEKYIPYIKSIFSYQKFENYIPYVIKENLFDSNDEILYILKKIFMLPTSRFENLEIIEFLNFKMIRKKFNISSKNLKILEIWINDININWGINKNHKKNIKIPKNSKNTWENGIKKIILGYFLNKTKIKMWGKIYPYNIEEKKHLKILEKFIIFIKILKKWKLKIHKSKKLKKWKKIFKNLIKDFFFINKNNKKKIKIIIKIVKNFIKKGILFKFKKKISIFILYQEILKKCKKIKKKNFLYNGSIIFCEINDFREIDFKIIYLIGQNENFKNTNSTINNLNLIKKYPTLNDVDHHQENYYKFIELIFSSKNIFYISYSKFNYKEEKIYLSLIINQFINYISNFFNINKKFFTYSYTKIKKFKNLYKNSFFKKNKKNKIFQKNFLISKKKIYIKNFLKFWKNPIYYFYNNQMNINYHIYGNKNPNSEPFEINKYQTNNIKKKIFNYLIKNKNYKKICQKILFSNLLPHENFGNILLKNIYKKSKKFYKKVKNINFYKKKFKLILKNIIIIGKLKKIKNQGILKLNINNITIHDKFNLWLKHLIYCVNKGKKESFLIGRKKKFYIFRNLKRKKAKKYLKQYLSQYYNGLKKPIIITNASLEWIQSIFYLKKKKIKKKIFKKKFYNLKKKFYSKIEGNHFFRGEKNNIYTRKIFKNIKNKKKIKKIYKKLKLLIFPMLKNIQFKLKNKILIIKKTYDKK